MNEFVILTKLIVVAVFPNTLFISDTQCEKVAIEWGCTGYVPTDPEMIKNRGREPEDLWLCDKDVFNKHLAETTAGVRRY